MIHFDHLKKAFLGYQTGMNQARKAQEFDMNRALQINQIRHTVMKNQQMQQMEQMRKLNTFDLDTPSGRSLYQVKQLLANRQRPQMTDPQVGMQNAFNRILLEKLV